MKKLVVLALLLLIFPFVVWGADCPQPDDCYTDRVTFEIMDSQGNVVDKTVYDRNVPMPYDEAMALKYLRLTRQVDSGAEVFLKILTTNGSAKQALEAQTGP